MGVYDKIRTQNTDGKKVEEARNPINVAAYVGVHIGCGGEIYMRLDNPFGTLFCKKCNRSCVGNVLNIGLK